MASFSKKIYLKPVEPTKLKIEKSNEFEEAYAFELELSSRPDSIWKLLFNQQLQESLYPTKRQVTILDDKLRVVTSPDTTRDKIEWIRDLVRLTNERAELYNKDVDKAKKAEEKRLAEEEETIKKMRESLK